MGSENRVGEVLASKYRLEEFLGSGAMGHVYRAVNQDVGRTVAIKVLRGEHAQNAQVVDRFLREARAANLVRHPNVVDVLDIGREAGGAPFIVQELLVGEDLAHFAERRGGKLPLEEVVDIMGPVIDAVAEAHARGVIHRDIKPENVFLAKGARGSIPKLLDFGISKVRAPDLRATDVGVTMGTPAYMPPEQVQGARDADPRSDVWALGVMLFELIAGRMPFDACSAPALFLAIATKDAPTLLEVGADVPPEISRLVARCLRRHPDERYPTAAELARDLRHVANGTELEPTGKRSVPAAAFALVPELAFPAAPLAPTMSTEGEHGKGNAAIPAFVTRGVGANAPRPVTSQDVPSAPSLLPPTPRGAPPVEPSPRGAGSVADRAPAEGRQPFPHRAPSGEPIRPAGAAALSGVGLHPGTAPAARTAAHSPRGPRPLHGDDIRTKAVETLAADTSTFIGAAIVGLIVILGVGLLMQTVHRPEGWPVARFVLQPGQSTEVALHGFLSLLAFGIGATYCWRGVRHWRGELAGGPPQAILSGLLAAAAFFSAIELIHAVM